ncbi:uncharacterized protein NEMAJ01_0438 [Nematocida major]|uniref:uncharacterized protein n=1 Tax=Nematocida major TaxID=1912982 RepID=UPI00200802D4|nr:uncharacterized protein NEMAJ01_0438 [Nematocida major]KAH9385542.1 hypothetical protein NEMAJ01_0438 [Nematocida major]
MPVLYTVSDDVVCLLQEKEGAEDSLLRVLDAHFTSRRYAPGEMSLAAQGLLREFLQRALLDPEYAHREGADCLAQGLWEEVCTYSCTGIEDVPLLISREGEAGDITVSETVCVQSIEKEIRVFIDRVAKEKIGGAFSLSGIWALGKALFTDAQEILEKQFFLGLCDPQKLASFLGVLSTGRVHPAITEMGMCGKVSMGVPLDEDFRVVSGWAFPDMVRYSILLYRSLSHTSEEGRGRCIHAMVEQALQLECGEEPAVRVALNLLLLRVFEQLQMCDARRALLLMDSGRILSEFAGDAALPESSREVFLRGALLMYTSAEAFSASPEIKRDLAKRAVAAASILGEETHMAECLAESWVEDLPAIMKYCTAQKARVCISAKARMPVRVQRSIKRGECVAKRKKSSHLEQARIRYVQRLVEEKDALHSGERAVFTLQIPDVPGECRAVLEVDSRQMLLKSKKIRLAFKNVTGEDRIVHISRVTLEMENGTLAIPIDRKIRVLPTEFVRPRVRYSREVSLHGMTKISTKGVASKEKGLLISADGRGYKSVKKQAFYGTDFLGRRIKIKTPHKYTLQEKPRVQYRVGKNADIKCRIIGSYRRVEVLCGHAASPNQEGRLTVRVKRRRVTREGTDDPVPEPQSAVSSIEAGVCQIISHSRAGQACSAKEMLIRHYFYRKSRILHMLRPFCADGVGPALELLPNYAGVSPLIIIHLEHAVVVKQLPLEKKLPNRALLLGSWRSLHALKSHCLFESKAAELDAFIRMASLGGAQGSADALTQERRGDSVWWYSSAAVVRASRHGEGSVIFVQNHSRYASIVCIIGMKITHVRPLETVVYKSVQSPEGLSIMVNTV